jgi:hypothetical protein
MGKPPEYSRLLKFAGAVVKYYLLAVFCFAVICLVLACLGAFQLVGILLITVGHLFLRLAVLIFCLIAVATIAEAWKHW